ncbi:calcium-binding protein [Inquilinus sp. OTU3971]|uniref:calcium-binding protein n=1 Tax=Inquilinus sp. OTU3971 TaxID=3043855 RepID=UPI00313E2C38
MAAFSGTPFDDILPGSGESNDGNDVMVGLEGNDRIDGGLGNDVCDGGPGADIIQGEAGNDSVEGGSEDDIIYGGGGDDDLSGGAGADTLIGNGGDDTYTVDAAGDTVTESSASEGADTVRSSVSYTLPQFVERLILIGSWNTSATGGGNADTLIGNVGANTLTGNGGADFLSGGNGNDVLRGGAGADILDGGNGIDAVTYTETSGVGVVVDLATGFGFLGAQGDSYSSIENVNGGNGDDTIIGTSADNVLNGWFGKDQLTGGGGADRFVFSAAAATAAADRITDFSQAQHDVIDLLQIDANVEAAGDQAFILIGSGPFTGQAGELRYDFGGGGTLIAGDVDGNGSSDFYIRLVGTIGLTAADFAL